MQEASSHRVHGPLRPIEVATAAVMGGVTVVLTIVGWFFPHASAISALGAVPLGVVGHRFRMRAVIAAVVAASLVAFLIAGTGPVSGVIVCGLVGAMVGIFRRRGYGALAVFGGATLLGPVLGGLADLMLLVLSSSRKLILAQARNVGHGFTGFLQHVGLGAVAHPLNVVINTGVRSWWIGVVVLAVVGVYGSTFMSWQVLGAVLERLAWVPTTDRLEQVADDGPPEPLPVQLTGVHFRYEGASVDALADIDLQLDVGEFVALAGPNGSGKSTLARVLAGRAPTSGSVTRLGGAGLGRVGGTAMVLQRPESQILGVRVADDVAWGLPPDVDVNVADLLTQVGLAGMEDRDTSTLSGGELQRLAVAAALARRPRLLVSDESTAMVDADGRRLLVDLLADLPRRYPMTVLHVTHHDEEAAAADRVVYLRDGRVVEPDAVPALVEPDRVDSLVGPDTVGSLVEPVGEPVGAGPGGRRPRSGPLLVARGVGHTYAVATPWAQQALVDVDLTIDEGEGVLVVGGNGSGKSTLAWVLTGLLRPSAGACLLEGRPVDAQVGRVALAFQHARLQIQRPTVSADVQAAGGVSADDAGAALRSVGLDPTELAERPVDQLSGGQLRRVALAGLLARKPRVLILDEPLAGLDTPTRASLLVLLGQLRRHEGLTLIVISHDLHGMAEVCDRTLFLEGGRLVGRARPDGVLAAAGDGRAAP